MTPPDAEDSRRLSSADARRIIGLVGEVAACGGELDAQKSFLMEGLCALIEADSWAWATTFRFEPKEVPLNPGFLCGGFSAAEFAKYQEALEHPDTAILNSGFTGEFQEKQTHLTRLRDQIDNTGYFLKSAVRPIWLAAGVEQVIQSVRPRKDGALSHLGFYRRPGRPAFSPRESRVVHIVLSEVPWLHEARMASDLGATVTHLTPRQRITLNLLLEGQPRPQIADHLGLSLDTVHGYVKGVFRQFGVHSQPALIARFQNGDGGDMP